MVRRLDLDVPGTSTQPLSYNKALRAAVLEAATLRTISCSKQVCKLQPPTIHLDLILSETQPL